MDPWLEAFFTASGGFALLALAAFVATIRPWRTVNVALALFALSLGLQQFTNAIRQFEPVPGPVQDVFWVATGVIHWVTVPLFLVVAVALTGGLWRENRRAFVEAGLLAGAVLAIFLVRSVAEHAAAGTLGWRWLVFRSYTVEDAAVVFALYLLALGALRTRDAPTVKRFAVASVGLGVHLFVLMGLFASDWYGGTEFSLAVLVPFLAGTLLFWSAVAARADVRRAALAVVGVSVAAAAAGYASGQFQDPISIFSSVHILAVGVLAYGVLRHQFLGTDLKIRATLSRGTVAASFLAVFLVVTEFAQHYFSESYGWVAGGAAAGMLVFAHAPLARAAERVATKAMPDVKPVARMDRGERLEAYRVAAAAAWTDGAMTVGERRMLEALREQLGLTADEATACERGLLANV